MPRHAFNDFDGLLLGQDARQAQKPSVLLGQNFIHTLKGPKAAFGNRIFDYTRFADNNELEVIDVDGTFLFFGSDAIYTYNSVFNIFVPVFVPSSGQDFSQFFPWSTAFVGGFHYFAKRGAPLLQYDPVTAAFTVIDIDAEITTAPFDTEPFDPVSVTEVGGRLIVLGEIAVAWSAIDDGTDLATNALAGIAQQLTAIAGSGASLSVRRQANGYIVYTETGRIHATFTDLVLPFRFDAVRDELLPISAFAITEMDESTHVCLTSAGLYSVTGFETQPFLPIVSEHIRQVLYERFDHSVVGHYSIYHNQDRQLFFISVSEGEIPGEYTSAIVVYLPTGKPGSFNHVHHRLFTLPPDVSSFAPDDLGFVDAQGYIRFISVINRTELFSLNNLIYKKINSDVRLEPRVQDGVTIFGSIAIMYDFLPSTLADDGLFQITAGEETVSFVAQPSSELEPRNTPVFFSDDTGFTDGTTFLGSTVFNAIGTFSDGFVEPGDIIYVPIFIGPASFVKLGPFRLVGEDQSDALQEIVQVIVGTPDSISTVISIDAEEDGSIAIIDLEAAINFGDLDFDEGDDGNIDYDVYVEGTLDGVNLYENEFELAELYLDSGNARFFNVDNVGIYTNVLIKADEIDDNFHVHTLELDTRLGGTL